MISEFGAHHMNVPGLLSEMKRFLKDSGWLILAEAGVVGKGLSVAFPAALRPISGGVRTRAEMEAVPNMHTGDDWRAMLSSAGFARIELQEHHARRAWYPRVLAIRAVASPDSVAAS